MIERTVTLINQVDFHAKLIALFVQTAGKFSSSIWVAKGEEKVNGKSLMGLMSLAALNCPELTICAEGKDENLAVKELVNIIASEAKHSIA